MDFDQSLRKVASPNRLNAFDDSNMLENLETNSQVRNWMVELSSRLLWVHGKREFNRASWQAEFCRRILAPLKNSRIVHLYVFCGLLRKKLYEEEFSVCGVIQSLIIQLLSQTIISDSSNKAHDHPSALRRLACKHYDLTQQRFEDASEDPAKLFSILCDVLEALRLRSLFIVIYGIHPLASATPTRIDGDAQKESQWFFNNLLELTTGFTLNRRYTKILVISEFPESPSEFLAGSPKSNVKFETIKVENQLYRSSPRSRVKQRQYRLSPKQVRLMKVVRSSYTRSDDSDSQSSNSDDSDDTDGAERDESSGDDSGTSDSESEDGSVSGLGRRTRRLF